MARPENGTGHFLSIPVHSRMLSGRKINQLLPVGLLVEVVFAAR
jgi:hypothetical protein